MFLDLQEVFDCLDHHILQERMSSLGYILGLLMFLVYIYGLLQAFFKEAKRLCVDNASIFYSQKIVTETELSPIKFL